MLRQTQTPPRLLPVLSRRPRKIFHVFLRKVRFLLRFKNSDNLICSLFLDNASSKIKLPNCRVKEFHPPYGKSFFAVFYLFIFLFSKCSLRFGERRLSYRLRYTCFCMYLRQLMRVNCCLLFLCMYLTFRLSKFSIKHYLLTYYLYSCREAWWRPLLSQNIW